MNTIQSQVFAILFTVSAAATTLFTGCASTGSRAASHPYMARNPAADGGAVVDTFTEALAKESGLGSQSEVERALNQIVQDNSEKLSTKHPIHSLDDIEALDSSDQKEILEKLVKLPGFSDRLATNSNVVKAARLEAMTAAQDEKQVATEGVADLHAIGSDVAQDTAGDVHFAAIVARDPELADTVKLMNRENNVIKQKTGGPGLLGPGCDDHLQDPQSAEVIATMEEGIYKKVASGEIKDTTGVATELRQEMDETLGTEDKESERRICLLSSAERAPASGEGGCRVFTPEMCTEH